MSRHQQEQLLMPVCQKATILLTTNMHLSLHMYTYTEDMYMCMPCAQALEMQPRNAQTHLDPCPTLHQILWEYTTTIAMETDHTPHYPLPRKQTTPLTCNDEANAGSDAVVTVKPRQQIHNVHDTVVSVTGIESVSIHDSEREILG